MKHLIVSLITLCSATLYGHGFGADTLVLLADNGWQQLSTVCYRAQKKKIAIASYDTTASEQTTTHVARGGRSTINCYVRFGFEERFKESQHHDEIACTPTQEFYIASTRQWVPAYMLKEGDELLCAHGIKKIVAYVALIKEPLKIYTVEVKHTHTFFVTQYSLLTHNMVLPIVFNLGLSIPFGAGAGGTAGGFFGPATFIVGAAIGCMVGALIKVVCDDKMPRYTVDVYDVNAFEQHIKQQPVMFTPCEPHITVSTNYVTAADNSHVPSTDLGGETFHDNEYEPLFSIVIQNPPQVTIGCGDTTPQKPLITVIPVEPMPTFQNPGYSPPLEEDRDLRNGGCGVMPDELKDLLNGPIILSANDNDSEDKINKVLEGSSYDGTSNEGTKIYLKPKGYEDGIKDFEDMELDGVKSIKNGEGFVGSLSDGRKINVRKTSKGNYKGEGKWPTLEIRSADGKRSKIKIRYTRETS